MLFDWDYLGYRKQDKLLLPAFVHALAAVNQQMVLSLNCDFIERRT